MCALTPLLPSKLVLGAPMEYPWLCTVESFLDSFPSFAEPDVAQYNHNYNSNSNSGGEDHQGLVTKTKKLTHNASERDRRKKLNSLYSSLRSLLPDSADSKKLSIPGTVSHVLKYIPELRQEVERLCRRKEQLVKRISRQSPVSSAHEHEEQRKRQRQQMNNDMSLRIVMTTWLTDMEVAVQITELGKSQIADALLGLEDNGLRVISVSSSVSANARVFHTLHLQMDEDCIVKIQEVNDKILEILEEKQELWHHNVQ